MHGLTGDPPSRAGSFMPPATTTRRFAERPASREDAHIIPPFVPSDVVPRRESTPSEAEPAAALGAMPEMAQPEPAQPEPTLAAPEQEVETSAPEAVEPPPAEAAADNALAAPAFEPEARPAEAEPIELSWESLIVEEEVVEPTFAADTDAVLNQLSDYAAELSQREEFPLDAFSVPDLTQQRSTEPDPQPPAPSPASSLAERLERLSQRLRVEQSEEIVRRLAAGDRFDALLAGLLAGYLAGKSEQ